MGLTDVASIRLRYVIRDPDRHGNERFYYRAPGQSKVRLPGKPGSEEFMAAYHAAERGETAPGPVKRAVPAAGSFRAACIGYYANPSFLRLDASTQAWQRRALDEIAITKGANPLRMLEPRHVRAMRDAKVATPAAANTMLKALRSLFRWAIEADLVDVDPTRDVRRIPYLVKGHHSWTLEEIEQFEGRHAVGTKARLAMTLLLYTTGRREDAARLGPQHIRHGRIEFVQAKNENLKPVHIDIPVHPDLAAVIAATPSGHLQFLVTEYGKPFSAAGFGNWFRDRCDEAGLPHCSAHGLRKAMAARLAERGASDHEIMAWTGHQTLSEVQRYTRAARRRLMADSALAKLKG